MTEQSMFFEDGSYYDQVVFARFPKDIVGHNGVVHNTDNELQVVANSPANMAVQVKTGRAWINGYIYEILTDPVNLAIEEADPSQERIDRVILRLNVNAPRGITAVVLKGTPGGGAPALTQTATVWEEPLYRVRVPANTTSIIQAYITDERDYMWFTEANQPKASASRYGAVKVGAGIDVNNGVISLSPYGAVPVVNVSTTNTDGFKAGAAVVSVPATSWSRTTSSATWVDVYTISGITYATKNCPPFVIMAGTGSTPSLTVTHSFETNVTVKLRAVDSGGNVLAEIEGDRASSLTLDIPIPYGMTSVKIQFYGSAEILADVLKAGSAPARSVESALYYNPVVTS